MTVKETAQAMGVSERTIQRHLKDLREEGLSDNVVVRGNEAVLSEKEVTVIKTKIEKSGRTDLAQVCELPKTNLEKQLLIRQAMLLQHEIIQELKEQLEEAAEKIFLDAPKVESFNALQKSGDSMSITQASKYFGLHPKTQVFPYLRDSGYLTTKDLPTQSAVDAGYMVQRLNPCPDQVFRPQAVVLHKQLETWRKKVIPQIAAWEAKNK